MNRALFILAVVATLFATAVLLYPRSSGHWTGYVAIGQGKYVADSSHRTLDDCRQYVSTHSGGECGLDCGSGQSCKQLVLVPESPVK